MWIKVNSTYTRPLLIGCVYRPPSADISYYESMLNHFEHILDKDNDIIILGDFNLDYDLDAEDILATNPAHYIELLLNCTQ